MSVPKSQRGQSSFEVLNNVKRMRSEIMKLIYLDFCFSEEKAEKYLNKLMFGKESLEDLTEEQQERYLTKKAQFEAFKNWFIDDERTSIQHYLKSVAAHISMANSISPMYTKELIERRIHQDKAIGCCEMILQELQFIIDQLPVNSDKYVIYTEFVVKEIALIKGWRKSDNKRFGHLRPKNESPEEE